MLQSFYIVIKWDIFIEKYLVPGIRKSLLSQANIILRTFSFYQARKTDVRY